MKRKMITKQPLRGTGFGDAATFHCSQCTSAYFSVASFDRHECPKTLVEEPRSVGEEVARNRDATRPSADLPLNFSSECPQCQTLFFSPEDLEHHAPHCTAVGPHGTAASLLERACPDCGEPRDADNKCPDESCTGNITLVNCTNAEAGLCWATCINVVLIRDNGLPISTTVISRGPPDPETGRGRAALQNAIDYANKQILLASEDSERSSGIGGQRIQKVFFADAECMTPELVDMTEGTYADRIKLK